MPDMPARGAAKYAKTELLPASSDEHLETDEAMLSNRDRRTGRTALFLGIFSNEERSNQERTSDRFPLQYTLFPLHPLPFRRFQGSLHSDLSTSTTILKFFLSPFTTVPVSPIVKVRFSISSKIPVINSSCPFSISSISKYTRLPVPDW